METLKKTFCEFKTSLFKKEYQIYLAFFSFFVVSTTTLVSTRPFLSNEENTNQVKGVDETRIFAPVPVLKDDYQPFPVTSAQAVLAIDLDSRLPLYEKNADVPLLPASTTKIMTALVALDYYPLGAILVVDGKKTDGQKMDLVKGERITAYSLLEGLLVYSANDAAEVLADNYRGGREAFIKMMNEKAEKLKLRNTHFENPTGFDGANHISTARDLIFLSEVAMENPVFAEIVGKKEVLITSIDGEIKHQLTNTNELLGNVGGVMGVKTGWTENARENLVTFLLREDKRIMIALLGSQDRFGETKEIISWIYANYLWQEVKYP